MAQEKTLPGKISWVNHDRGEVGIEKANGDAWYAPLKGSPAVLQEAEGGVGRWYDITFAGGSIIMLEQFSGRGGGDGRDHASGRGSSPPPQAVAPRSPPPETVTMRDKLIFAECVLKAHIERSGEWPKPSRLARYTLDCIGMLTGAISSEPERPPSPSERVSRMVEERRREDEQTRQSREPVGEPEDIPF